MSIVLRIFWKDYDKLLEISEVTTLPAESQTLVDNSMETVWLVL